ncbi:MAG: hypothetical protein H8D47_03835 [Planctomycetes bacterium]|nr:hypothetical protein [Planctomycetota bacterium]
MQIAIWTKNADKTTDKINALWPKPSYINLIEQSVHTPGSTDEKVLAFMIQLFSMLAIGLILAFIFSFYFSANTIIYASLRKKVDDNAIDDIYTQTKE